MKKLMMFNPAVHSTRTVTLVLLAAFAGIAVWLFAPWDGSGSWNGDGSAALPPSLAVDGTVQVSSENDIVTRLVVPLTVRGDELIALPEDNAALRVETAMSESATAAVPATWTITWLDGNGDRNLDPGERAELTVQLPSRSSIHPDNPLRIVLKPTASTALVIEDVIR